MTNPANWSRHAKHARDANGWDTTPIKGVKLGEPLTAPAAFIHPKDIKPVKVDLPVTFWDQELVDKIINLARLCHILNETTDWIRQQTERTAHNVSVEGITEHEAYAACYQKICDLTNQTQQQTDSTQNQGDPK